MEQDNKGSTNQDLEMESNGMEFQDKEETVDIPIPLAEVELSGKIKETNQHFEELTGYSAEDIEEATNLFVEEDKERFEGIEKEVKKGESSILQRASVLSNSGKKITVRVTVSPKESEEEDVIGYFLALSQIGGVELEEAEEEAEAPKAEEEAEDKSEPEIDSTQEKEIEEIDTKEQLRRKNIELAKSRKALMNILEDVKESQAEAEREKNETLTIINNFADGLIVAEQEGKINIVNPKAEEVLGIKKQKTEGKNLKDFEGGDNLLSPAIDSLFNEEGKIKDIERKEFSPKEGLVLEITTVLVEREEQKNEYLIIFHDITREKRIEKMKTQFVSIAAHQLRTPLSAIKWSLSLLKEKVDTEEEEKLIKKATDSNKRMIRLINDLLDATHIEEGKYISDLEWRDVKKLIKDTVESLKKEAEEKDLEVHASYPEEDIPEMKVDAEKITVCVQNLMENAFHYTSAEEGKIKIKLEYEKEKGRIIFSVEDNGIGIPEPQQDRIFEKFFRAENAMKSDTEGSGLGLFIVKNVIESHGGEVWFESEEGVGTTFYFSLPVPEK